MLRLLLAFIVGLNDIPLFWCEDGKETRTGTQLWATFRRAYPVGNYRTSEYSHLRDVGPPVFIKTTSIKVIFNFFC